MSQKNEPPISDVGPFVASMRDVLSKLSEVFNQEQTALSQHQRQRDRVRWILGSLLAIALLVIGALFVSGQEGLSDGPDVEEVSVTPEEPESQPDRKDATLQTPKEVPASAEAGLETPAPQTKHAHGSSTLPKEPSQDCGDPPDPPNGSNASSQEKEDDTVEPPVARQPPGEASPTLEELKTREANLEASTKAVAVRENAVEEREQKLAKDEKTFAANKENAIAKHEEEKKTLKSQRETLASTLEKLKKISAAFEGEELEEVLTTVKSLHGLLVANEGSQGNEAVPTEPAPPLIAMLSDGIGVKVNRLIDESLSNNINEISNSVQDLETTIERLAAQMRRESVAEDVVLVLYDSKALPVKKYFEAVRQCIKKCPPKETYPNVRWGVHMATNTTLTSLSSLGEPIHASSWMLPERDATGLEAPKDLKIADIFATENEAPADHKPRRHCILVVSDECLPLTPDDENWKNVDVDVLVIDSKFDGRTTREQKATLYDQMAKWDYFCRSMKNSRGEAVLFHVRRDENQGKFSEPTLRDIQIRLLRLLLPDGSPAVAPAVSSQGG